MGRAISHKVLPHEAAQRLDAVVGSLPEVGSRSQAAKACEAGRVLVNGTPEAKKYLTQEGDFLIIELPDEAPELAPEPIPLDIRYEDEHLLVLSKPAGLVTHPSPDRPFGSLASALLYRYGWDGLCNVQGEQDRPGIVHRLDADTSGLMLAAKTDEAGQALMDAIAAKAIDRRYLALVHGVISVDTGMIDAPIQRHPMERMQMMVGDGPSARDAITTFTVLERFSPGTKDMGYTLVECKLFTGRTHQIRVHMQYTKHPIVGDQTYTAHTPKWQEAALGLERQFLHSYKLGFTHPITGEVLGFEDTLPDDLELPLLTLRSRLS